MELLRKIKLLLKHQDSIELLSVTDESIEVCFRGFVNSGNSSKNLLVIFTYLDGPLEMWVAQYVNDEFDPSLSYKDIPCPTFLEKFGAKQTKKGIKLSFAYSVNGIFHRFIFYISEAELLEQS